MMELNNESAVEGRVLTGHESYDGHIHEFASTRPMPWILVVFFGEIDDLGL